MLELKSVTASEGSHYLALLAREVCHRGGDVVTWDEVVNSKKAFASDTNGLKA